MPEKFGEIRLLLNKMHGYKHEQTRTMIIYLGSLEAQSKYDKTIFKKLKARHRQLNRFRRSFFDAYFTGKAKLFIRNLALIKRKVDLRKLVQAATEISRRKKVDLPLRQRTPKKIDRRRKQLTPKRVLQITVDRDHGTKKKCKTSKACKVI